MSFPSEKEVLRIKESYPEGTQIRLEKMDDPQAPPVGTIGTVILVDDAGQIHPKWENGSGLAVVLDAGDKITVLNHWYRWCDGWFTYYINVTTGEKKFELDEEDIEISYISKLDDFS